MKSSSAPEFPLLHNRAAKRVGREGLTRWYMPGLRRNYLKLFEKKGSRKPLPQRLTSTFGDSVSTNLV